MLRRLWLLALAPVVLVAAHVAPEAHTTLFVLSIAAIVPLAALLSHATEAVAARTGDTIGGLLNATFGNLTELVIAITALRLGMVELVKASIAGVIVANLLFMLGASFLLGGLRHHEQEYSRATARLQVNMLLLAAVALLVPSALADRESLRASGYLEDLSVALAILLIACYALGLVFSLGTHRRRFGGEAQAQEGETHGGEASWPLPAAVGALLGATVLIAAVSHVFVESVQHAAAGLGMSEAFVGFVIVALVGGAAESFAAISAARKDRLDMSVGIAMGSSAQIALFVAPVVTLASHFVGPAPMDLTFPPGQVAAVFVAMLAAALAANSGKSSWYHGVQLIAVYLVFAATLYLLPGGS
jgi:Ca2+:H+ antiporter